MKARRSIGVLTAMCLAVVLTACGNDRESSTPTPTTTSAVTATKVIVVETPTPTEVATQATPMADATPVAGATPLTGTITLSGAEHITFYQTEEGCYGLGEWRGLQPGAQLVVRNAAGVVIDTAQLEATSGDDCAWTFSTYAPASDYVGISVPMVMEQWFSAVDLVDGSVTIELP